MIVNLFRDLVISFSNESYPNPIYVRVTGWFVEIKKVLLIESSIPTFCKKKYLYWLHVHKISVNYLLLPNLNIFNCFIIYFKYKNDYVFSLEL